jgi:hypothetical protein
VDAASQTWMEGVGQLLEKIHGYVRVAGIDNYITVITCYDISRMALSLFAYDHAGTTIQYYGSH